MTRSTSPVLLAILLASLGALGPFSIDTYLPSFPEIGASLNASQLQVQQTLTAFLLPFAVMTLWHGSLSDALGRKPVILGALGLFALASLGCALAGSIDALWFWRAMQGITAGAGIVIGRAVVRDLFQGPAAQRLMSHIAIMFALAPAIAPIIGGWLHVWFGWRAIFIFLVGITLLLLFACWRYLPETLPPAQRVPLHAGQMLSAYRQVLASPAFLATCLALALNFAGFFIYIVSAPVFLMRHLGLPETSFLWLFGPAMSGLMLGSWLSGRLAGHLSGGRTIALGYLIMGSAALLNVGVNLLLPPALPWTVLPIPLYTCGMAVAMASLTLAALDLFPARRGLAASCQTFIQSSMNALVAGMIGPLLWDSTKSMAIGMFCLMGLGLCCFAGYRRAMRRLPPHQQGGG